MTARPPAQNRIFDTARGAGISRENCAKFDFDNARREISAAITAKFEFAAPPAQPRIRAKRAARFIIISQNLTNKTSTKELK